MQLDKEDRKGRGIEMITGSDIDVDIDDNVDIPTLLLEIRRKPINESDNAKEGKAHYIVGEKKVGVYVEETGGLAERDAHALIELLPDYYIYMRKQGRGK